MKHKLLVPVDGEKASWKTAQYAARACAGHGAKTWGIVLFHVLPECTHLPGKKPSPQKQAELIASFERETPDGAEKMLADLRERVIREGVAATAVTTKIARNGGKVVEQILWAATNENCDTIVVGRRGKSMFGQFLSHGVVEQLLRNPTGFTIWVVE
jgi:nucleotide-binding universal stress UspA family protein